VIARLDCGAVDTRIRQEPDRLPFGGVDNAVGGVDTDLDVRVRKEELLHSSLNRDRSRGTGNPLRSVFSTTSSGPNPTISANLQTGRSRKTPRSLTQKFTSDMMTTAAMLATTTESPVALITSTVTPTLLNTESTPVDT
jgi:hypothetical protein